MSNGFTDITGSALQVRIRFPDQNQNWTEFAIPAAFLSSQAQQLLATPLSDQFQTFWSVTKDNSGQTQRDRATTLAQDDVSTAVRNNTGQTAYNIAVSFPASRRLLAAVSGDLVLHYALPGEVITFNSTTSSIFGSYADPAFKLTFDAALEIASPIPATPCTFSPSAAMIIENANLSGDNFIGKVVEIVGDLLNFFQGQPPIFQAAEGNIDGVNPVGTGSLADTFAQLASACVQAQAAGFVQFEVDVDQSIPALVFRLIHPLDDPPNFDDQTFPNLFHPLISVSQLQIIAGHTLGVSGNYFTPPNTVSLVLQWNDTISGDIVKSEIEWGPQGGPTNVVPIPRQPFDSGNTYEFSGLAPNQTYTFRVRDWDQTTCTPWSAWKSVSMQNSTADQVMIWLDQDFLNPLNTVPLQADGTFSTTVVIPGTTTPVPHVHLVDAQLMGGAAAPPVQIQVLEPGAVYSPTVEMIDPMTNQPIASTVQGYQFGVIAYGFHAGSVSFTIDSSAGTYVGQATAGGPDGSVPVPTAFTMPNSVPAGAHQLFASQTVGGSTVTAKCPFFCQEIPH